MFRTLKDRIIEIYDENIIKIAYCFPYKYDSYKSSDNEDEGAMNLVETSNNVNDKIMRPHVLEFDYDIEVDDIIYNN